VEAEAAAEEDSAIADWKIEMEMMERMLDAKKSRNSGKNCNEKR